MVPETGWRVPYIDLAARFLELEPGLSQAVSCVLAHGRFVNGPCVAFLEDRLARLVGKAHVVAVNSGYDALFLALKALGIGPGDEVVTVSHTFAATVAAITHVGATPVLVDVDEQGLMEPGNLDAALTPRTRVVVPVHLNGALCRMETVKAFAETNRLLVVEDAAQAIGARDWGGRQVGVFADAACFSLHPLKVVGAAGDGGFVATDYAAVAQRLKRLRNHGHEDGRLASWGYNSRMDEVQAVVVDAQLNHIDRYVGRRRQLAFAYNDALRDVVTVPFRDPGATFASYVIRTGRRDALQRHLGALGVETFAHWPVPLHLQPELALARRHPLPVTERLAREVLSLPIYPEMTDWQQAHVVACIREFYGGA